MTESEVRKMLENYRIESANLEYWFEHKKGESIEEFYEGEQESATDYARDKVQSSKATDDSMINLICKKGRRTDEEPDEIIEKMYADRLRLHRLDCAVYDLPSVRQSIIRQRYYEGKSILQVCFDTNYSYGAVKKITKQAIKALSERIL